MNEEDLEMGSTDDDEKYKRRKLKGKNKEKKVPTLTQEGIIEKLKPKNDEG